MHALTTMLNKHKVPWQTGENGKIDVGGGGTVAMFIANMVQMLLTWESCFWVCMLLMNWLTSMMCIVLILVIGSL